MVKKFEGQMDFIGEKDGFSIFIFFITVLVVASAIGITNFIPVKTPSIGVVQWVIIITGLLSLIIGRLVYKNKSIRKVSFELNDGGNNLRIHHGNTEIFNMDNFLFEGVLVNFSAYKSTKVQSFFTLRIFDDNGNVYSYSEKIESGTKVSNIELNEVSTLEGIMVETIHPYPSFVFETFKNLLEWSNQPGSQINRREENPFEE